VHECHICSAIGTHSDFQPLEDAAYSARVLAQSAPGPTAELPEDQYVLRANIEKKLLGSKDDKEFWKIGVGVLRDQVANERAAGKMSELRSQTNVKTLESLQELIENSSDDLPGRIVHGGRLGELLERFIPTLSSDDVAPRVAASRSGNLLLLLDKLRIYLVKTFVLTFGKPNGRKKSSN
jgi:hypothetical protein